ncbi:hypothetical protein CPB84DRAFT_198566 [Gymnopilus junonius]|uniref:Uncharacterized protein n=1 Tax=Gymnopilus junonius TaxID=109634 RepID=A0A9P5NWW4_GYMJU|nr:hypothetical protein CPB84DRAFT_198566 [Gymnopilus junonius]
MLYSSWYITDAKRQLQKHVQDEEVAQSSSSAAQSGMNPHSNSLRPLTRRIFLELKVVIEALKANEQVLQGRYENAEMERVKAVGAEHQGGYDRC